VPSRHNGSRRVFRVASQVLVVSMVAMSCSNNAEAAKTTSSTTVAKTTTTAATASPRATADPFDPSECPDRMLAPCDSQNLVRSVPVLDGRVTLTYTSDRVLGRTIAPVGDPPALGLGGWTVDGVHTYSGGVLFLGNGQRRVVAATNTAKAGELAIPDLGGAAVFVFDEKGRHVRTIETLSGVVAATMSYTTDSALASVTDRYGNTIRIAASPTIVTLTASATSVSQLVLSPDGYVASIDAGTPRAMSYTYGKGGLLATETDSHGGTTSFEYDAGGLLTSTTDASRAVWKSVRTATRDGFAITNTAPNGQSSSVTMTAVTKDELQIDVVGVDGRKSTATATRDGHRTRTAADGSKSTLRYEPDTRFGWALPVLAESRWNDATGSTVTAAFTTKVVLSESKDPLSLAKLTTTTTDQNGASTVTYDRAQRTSTTIDTRGVTSRIMYDRNGDVVTSQPAERAAATTTVRDAKGTVSTVTTGTTDARVEKITQNADGTRTFTDSLDRSVRTSRRSGTSTVTLPDGRSIVYETAPDGTPIATSGTGYSQLFASDARGVPLGTTLSSNGTRSTVVTRDLAGRVGSITGPDGRVITNTWASSGQLDGRSFSAGAISYTYDAASKGLLTATAPGGIVTKPVRNGAVIIGDQWAGPVAGIVKREVDAENRITGIDIAGTTIPATTAGGVLRNVGGLSFTFDSKTGTYSSNTIGAITETRDVNGFGELVRLTVRKGTSVIYDALLTRDKGGRIATRVETLDGAAPRTTTYRYDLTDRLVGVSETGQAEVNYAYDESDQRTTTTVGDVSTTYGYDAKGVLTSAGDLAFEFGLDGRLAAKQGPAGRTSYVYDEFGGLRQVALADGRKVEYLIDAAGRRIGKKIDNVLTSGWLYDGEQVVAELDGLGAVVARFVYAGGRVPSLVLRDGKTFRVIEDAASNPRLVIDTASGEIVDRIDFDAFGVAPADATSRVLPTGFAGGLEDSDTGLVRLGSRDYDPTVGRFTAPDPAGLHGVRMNPYVYAGHNPVNRIDPSGLADGRMTDEQKKAHDKAVAALADLLNALGAGLDAAGSNVGPLADGASVLTDLMVVLTASDPKAAAAAFPSLLADTAKFLGGVNGIPALSTVGKAASLGKAIGEARASSLAWTAGKAARIDVAKTAFSTMYEVATFVAAIATMMPGLAPLVPILLAIAALAAATAAALALACGVFECDGAGGFRPGPGGGRGGGGDDGQNGGGSGEDSVWKKLKRVWNGGDPHIATFDGFEYSFHGLGEFMLAKSSVDTFRVQVRYQPVSNSGLTYATAAVVQTDRERVQIDSPELGGALRVRVDGADIELTTNPKTLAGGSVLMQVPRGVSIALKDGTRVRATKAGKTLTIEVGLAESREGKVVGLGGNANEVKEDDLAASDGTVVAAENRDALYLVFGESWRVAEPDSLFTYAAGTNWATFARPGYVPPKVDRSALDPAARKRAEQTCERARITDPTTLENCVLDVGFTDDPTLALVAYDRVKQVATQPPPIEPGEVLAIGDSVATTTIAAKATRLYTIRSKPKEVVYLQSTRKCPRAESANNARWIEANEKGEIRSFSSTGQSTCADIGRVVANDNGRVYVLVTGPTKTEATFGFRVRPVPPDQDFDITLPAAVKPDNPGRGAGVAEAPGSIDRYHFSGNATQRIRIAISMESGRDDDNVTKYRLVDATGAQVLADFGRVPKSVDLPVTGQYTLEVTYPYDGYDGPNDSARYLVAIDTPSSTSTSFSLDSETTADVSQAGAVITMPFDAAKGETYSFEWLSPACQPYVQGFAWKVEDLGKQPTATVKGAVIPGLAQGNFCQSIPRVEIPASGRYQLTLSSPNAGAGIVRFRARKVVDQRFNLVVGVAITKDSPAGAGVLEGFGAADFYTITFDRPGSYKIAGTTCGRDVPQMSLTSARGSILNGDLCSVNGATFAIRTAGAYTLAVYDASLVTTARPYSLQIDAA
jgi:RHS repeat-associated protein